MLHVRFAHPLKSELFNQEGNPGELCPRVGGQGVHFRVHDGVRRFDDPSHACGSYSIKAIIATAAVEALKVLSAAYRTSHSFGALESSTRRGIAWPG